MTPRTGRSLHQVRIASPAGTLEGLLRAADQPRGGALLCHPHPLFGGTMQNRLVVTMERGFVESGISTLRFNFRGAGRSAGVHDGGRGEKDDVRSALEELAARVPGLPLAVGGYSFGASVGLTVGARDPRVVGLLGVGVSFRFLPPPDLSGFRGLVVVVQGDRDELGPLAEVRAWAEGAGDDVQVVVAPGADHFFAGDLATTVRRAAAGLGRRVADDQPRASPSGP